MSSSDTFKTFTISNDGEKQEQLHIMRNHLMETELRSLIFSSLYYLNEQYQHFSLSRAFSISVFQKFVWNGNWTNAYNHLLNNTFTLNYAMTLMILMLSTYSIETT